MDTITCRPESVAPDHSSGDRPGVDGGFHPCRYGNSPETPVSAERLHNPLSAVMLLYVLESKSGYLRPTKRRAKQRCDQ